MSIRSLVGCVCVLGLVAFAAPSAASAASEASCTKVASPTGEDSAAGTAVNPYATAQKLVDSLAAGQTGCLRAGTFEQEELTIRTPGIQLTSYPGERATIVGRLRVVADWVTVDHLTLDGRNLRDLPSPTINADDVAFRDNNVHNANTEICFILGSTTQVDRTVLERNRIHNCGVTSTNYDHGIYMQDVDDAEIVGNTIYDNGSRGIKVGPDAQRALISGNVIDGNPVGVSFSGNTLTASSDNVVEHNIISYSRRRWNVEDYWPELVGAGNVVRQNCLYGGNPDPYYNPNGGVEPSGEFTAEDNVVGEPKYVNRAGNDFRLRPESPCRAVYSRGF